MKFFKENSYDIIRLYINQIGITIFSLLLYIPILNLKNEALKPKLMVTISVFAILFYFALLYTASWDWGAKDKIRIDAKRIECKKYKGALMALIANIPNFLLATICSITMFIHIQSNAGAAYSVYYVFNSILRLSAAMYLGLLQGIFSAVENNEFNGLFVSLGYLFLPALAIGVTHLGYIFGLKEFKIFKTRKKQK